MNEYIIRKKINNNQYEYYNIKYYATGSNLNQLFEIKEGLVRRDDLTGGRTVNIQNI